MANTGPRHGEQDKRCQTTMIENYQATMKLALRLKRQLNYTKIALGIVLNQLREYHNDPKIDSGYGDFNMALDSLQLNLRRSIQIMENGQWVVDQCIEETMWQYYDSSVIESARKHKEVPDIDDVRELGLKDLL